MKFDRAYHYSKSNTCWQVLLMSKLYSNIFSILIYFFRHRLGFMFMFMFIHVPGNFFDTTVMITFNQNQTISFKINKLKTYLKMSAKPINFLYNFLYQMYLSKLMCNFIIECRTILSSEYCTVCTLKRLIQHKLVVIFDFVRFHDVVFSAYLHLYGRSSLYIPTK
jgi:hypothetical protein